MFVENIEIFLFVENMPGSQKSSPSKNCPLTRGRYRKMVSKSKGKRSPVKGRTSPISGITGSSQLKNSRKPKKENDFSELSEEEQLQKVLEESRIESMSPNAQLKLAIAASLRDLLNIPGDQNVLSVPTIPTPRKPMSQEMPKEMSNEKPKEMSQKMSQEIPKEKSKELSNEKPKEMSQKMCHEMPQEIKEMPNISEISKELNKRIALYNERQNMQKWKMDSQSILNIREKTPEKEIPENSNSDYSGKLKKYLFPFFQILKSLLFVYIFFVIFLFTGSLAKLNKRVELIRIAKRMEKTPEKEITNQNLNHRGE